MKEPLLCKIPTREEMERQWNDELAAAGEAGRRNCTAWKEEAIRNVLQGYSIPYYGFCNGQIVCEATAMLHPGAVQNSEGLVGPGTAYLCAFRTVPAQQGKGYFSQLFRFMLADLQKRGYTKVTLGVEPQEVKNRQIYQHYGFTQFIKQAAERWPDGTEITVDYYAKPLQG